MRFFARLTASVLVIIGIGLMGSTLITRALPLPTELQELGFGHCDGKPCLQYDPDEYLHLVKKPLPVAWVLAWLGVPCEVNSSRGSVYLLYPTAKVYAQALVPDGMSAWELSGRLRANDDVLQLIPIVGGTCQPMREGWYGLSQRSPTPADASQPWP
jgi:hypothetical protein